MVAGHCPALLQSGGESQSAAGELGRSSGHRSELFKVTVPLNENSLMKWSGEVQHGLETCPRSWISMSQHIHKALVESKYLLGGLHVHSEANVPLKYKIQNCQVKQILLLPTVEKGHTHT